MSPLRIRYSEEEEEEEVNLLIIVKWNLGQVPADSFKSVTGHFCLCQ
jgi:hypothetical protein